MFKRIKKICEHCNNTYQGTKVSKYCGYDCAKASRKRRVILNCKHCNKEFEVQIYRTEANYCSYECKYKDQSSEIIEIICDYCHNTFTRKSHKVGKHNFCSHDCSNKYNVGSNHYEWKESLHDKHYKLALKQWGISIKKRDNYTCQVCGETDKELLEAHHIKYKSKYPELQFDYDNGITLCQMCHAIEHKDDPKAFRLINNKIARNRKKK